MDAAGAATRAAAEPVGDPPAEQDDTAEDRNDQRAEAKAGESLGIVSDPFGEKEYEVLASDPGLLIGRANLPVVNEGDAVFHVARIKQTIDAESTIDALATHLEEDPLFDEDEII